MYLGWPWFQALVGSKFFIFGIEGVGKTMKIITIIRDVYIYVFGFLLRAVILAAVLDEHCIVIVVIVSGTKNTESK